MCGPLVLAIPGSSGRLISHILYNLGRITTYTMSGLVLGSFGRAVVGLAATVGLEPLPLLARIQVALSAIAALFLFCFGLIRLGLLPEPEVMAKAMPTKIPGFQTVRQGVMIDKSTGGCYLFGVMLGFLPCGLSYAAFAMALAAGGPLQGGLTTFAFGVGTLPALMFVGTIGSRLANRYRRLSDLLAGIIMIGMAANLIVNLLTAFF